MELQPTVAGITTCGCGQALGPRQDAMHYIECMHGRGSNTYSRVHDAVERQVYGMARQVYLGTSRVQTQDYVGSQGYSPGHVPDVTVFDCDGEGGTMVVEVSVFRPTCETHLPTACGTPGAASAAVERRRLGDYGTLPSGTRWRPFVLDTFGHMGPETTRFFSDLVSMRGDRLDAQGAWPLTPPSRGP